MTTVARAEVVPAFPAELSLGFPATVSAALLPAVFAALFPAMEAVFPAAVLEAVTSECHRKATTTLTTEVTRQQQRADTSWLELSVRQQSHQQTLMSHCRQQCR